MTYISLTNLQHGAYTIPVGADAIICTYAIHRDPEHWPDPEKFDPDRFSVIPRANTFIPFGGGGHMCIGNRFAMIEMKAVLGHLVRRFTNFKLSASKPVKLSYAVTLKADVDLGMHVTVAERV